MQELKYLKIKDMGAQNEVIGIIDIGTTKIVALIGESGPDNKIKILGFAEEKSEGVIRGAVKNIDETARIIETVMEKAQNMADYTIKEVYIGISDYNLRSFQNSSSKNYPDNGHIFNEADYIEMYEEINLTAINPGEKILHVFPQSFTIDNEPNIKNPIGCSGRSVKGTYHIIVCNEANIANTIRSVEAADFKVVGMFLESLASSEAVLYPDEKEAGVALIDIGGGTSDVAVFHDKILRHTGIIPGGGILITNDIRNQWKILHRAAETVKVQHGLALRKYAKKNEIYTSEVMQGSPAKEIPAEHLAGVIQARMEEIIDNLVFEINNSGIYSQLSGLVITGGGANLKYLPQLIKERTGFDVRLAEPNPHLIYDMRPELKNTKYATAIGLLRLGLENEAKLYSSSGKKKSKNKSDSKKSGRSGGFKEFLDSLFKDSKDTHI